MKNWSAPTQKRRWFGPSPLARAWVLSFLCWGIVACSLGIEAAARTQNLWLSAVRPGITDWLPWAVLTPLIFLLVRHLPIDRQHWKVALPVHILCGIATVLFCQWWKDLVDRGFGASPALPEYLAPMAGAPPPPPTGLGGPAPAPASLGPEGAFDMLRMATFELPIYLMLVSGAHTLTFYRKAPYRD
jgi:hypothetical protein